jgi:hypothetical protein
MIIDETELWMMRMWDINLIEDYYSKEQKRIIVRKECQVVWFWALYKLDIMMPSLLPVKFDSKTEWVFQSISIQVGEKMDSKIVHKGFACMCPLTYVSWKWIGMRFSLGCRKSI